LTKADYPRTCLSSRSSTAPTPSTPSLQATTASSFWSLALFWYVIRMRPMTHWLIVLKVEGSDRPMSFTQAFNLKQDNGSFYVLNDVFRIVYPAA
jgi:hypothetical protein